MLKRVVKEDVENFPKGKQHIKNPLATYFPSVTWSRSLPSPKMLDAAVLTFFTISFPYPSQHYMMKVERHLAQFILLVAREVSTLSSHVWHSADAYKGALGFVYTFLKKMRVCVRRRVKIQTQCHSRLQDWPYLGVFLFPTRVVPVFFLSFNWPGTRGQHPHIRSKGIKQMSSSSAK